MKIAVIIPTFNEKENIAPLIREILALNIEGLEIVVVDDNSSDGTGEIVEELKIADVRVHLVRRGNKLGLGTAYLEGFRYSWEKEAEYFFEMDADFSHDPKLIPVFLEEISRHALVVGSRYVSGGKIKNWNFSRKFISRIGNLFARIILSIPVRDLTTGFKCYRRKAIEHLKTCQIASIGYVFQIETTYHLHQNNFSIKEIPIVFTERRIGRSKFNLGIIWESFWRVLKIKLAKISRVDRTAYFLVLAFILFFSFLSFGRHDALKSYLNDLGTYDQVIWNTLNGHFFDNSANMLGATSYLGAHFSPILAIFTPFYFLLATPKWLLFFQALAVGIAALFVWQFSKEKLGKGNAALIFLLSFLINPFLHNALLYDFHEVTLAVLFAAGAFYFLEKRRDGWFIFFSLLLALSQEHLVLLVFTLGLYALFIQKRKKFGALVSGAALIYFLLVINFLLPAFSGGGNSAFLKNNSPYGSRYAWLGSNPGEILKNVSAHPLAIAKIIFSAERREYLVQLILPLFSLALYSWPVLVIFPLVLINLLSANSMTFNIYFYHSAVFIPFLYFSAILTFKRWFWKDDYLRKIFLGLILAASVASFVLYSLTPIASRSKFSDFQPGEHAKKLAEIKKIIPSEVSLSVQHNLGPHFSERRELYRFPLKKDEVDYVLLDEYNVFESNPKQVFGWEYALQMDIQDWQKDITELKQSPQYDLIYNQDGYRLFRRK